MSINSIRETIEQEFYDNWTGTDVDTHVRYSNAIFKPPEDEDWASIDIRWLPSINSSICSTLSVRRKGILKIDVLAPVDKGVKSISILGDEAISIFENKQIPVTVDAVGTSINFMAANIVHVGVPNIQGIDPAWYKFTVGIVFYRDE